MHRGLGIDVFERDQPIVGIHGRRRDLAVDDLAEETVGHSDAIVVLSTNRLLSLLTKHPDALYALQVGSNRYRAPAGRRGERAHSVGLTESELDDQRPGRCEM